MLQQCTPASFYYYVLKPDFFLKHLNQTAYVLKSDMAESIIASSQEMAFRHGMCVSHCFGKVMTQVLTPLLLHEYLGRRLNFTQGRFILLLGPALSFHYILLGKCKIGAATYSNRVNRVSTILMSMNVKGKLSYSCFG